MAKWKKGDFLVKKDDDLKIISILELNADNYLIRLYPTSVRQVVSHKDFDSQNYTLIKGAKDDGTSKNASVNDRGSKSGRRKTKTSSPVPKSSKDSTNRKKSKAAPASGSSDSPSSSKPRARRWWKKRKKSVRSKNGLKHPNKSV